MTDLEIVDGEPLSGEQSAAALSRPAAGQVTPHEGSSTLEQFDVLLARDLDPPLRHIQQYVWLDTMAADARAAVRMAIDWCEREQADFEVTGMARRGRLREPVFGALSVDWGIAVERRTPPGAIVRHPSSGLRVGFVATPAAEARHMPPQAAGEFRLITRKPTDRADPVCLAPLVDLVGWA